MGLKKTAAMPLTATAAHPENAKPAETAVAEPVVLAQPVLTDTSVEAEDIPDTEEETEVPDAEVIGGTTQQAIVANAGAGQLSTQVGPSDGFAALDNKMGYGSFLILKLDKTSFMLGSKDVGVEQFLMMKGAREKHLYKEKDKKETTFLFYSYDHVTHGTGSSVAATLKEWKAKGIEWEVKTYMEVLCKRVERDGNGGWKQLGVCLANVPPASVTRLSGYRYEVTSVDGLKLDEIVTRAFVGDKVTFGKTTFHPWNFEVAQAA